MLPLQLKGACKDCWEWKYRNYKKFDKAEKAIGGDEYNVVHNRK